MATSGQRNVTAPSASSSCARRSSSRVSGKAIVATRELSHLDWFFTVRSRPQQGRTQYGQGSRDPQAAQSRRPRKTTTTLTITPTTRLPLPPRAKRTSAKRASASPRRGATTRVPCGSGKKYKKCHLAADEQATIAPPEAPDAKELAASGWRLFEQRRPGAAEKEFRAALAVDPSMQDAHVGIGMARLSAGNADGAKEELGASSRPASPRSRSCAPTAPRTRSASPRRSRTSAPRTRSAAWRTTRTASRTR